MRSVCDLRRVPGGSEDEFVFPRDLFEAAPDSPTTLWTCVRTRPRWEKKLAVFLRSRRIPYYLPVTIRQTHSGRKHRSTSVPFFSGFVFVQGRHTKQSLKDSACVTNVLRPASAMHHKELDGQIRAIHRVLTQPRPADLITQYHIGARVTIESGPLRGLSGTVIATANAKRLVVWIDMLGIGASVLIGYDTRLAVA